MALSIDLGFFAYEKYTLTVYEKKYESSGELLAAALNELDFFSLHIV